jgi:hypothetical protein
MASTDRQFRTYAALTLTSARQLCSRRRRGAKWVCMAVHDLPTVGFLPEYLGDPIGAPFIGARGLGRGCGGVFVFGFA